MEKTIEKLNKLHQSTQKLETILQEMWSLIDEIGEDENFTKLLNRAKQYQSKTQESSESMEALCDNLQKFENFMGQIPEDGTAAVDFEDSISELIDWMNNNN